MTAWHISGIGAALIVTALPAMAQAQAIPGVLAPGATPQLVQEGFKFTEGPLAADGGLYFSDIPANRTYFLDPGGKIAPVRENTNGANGIAIDKDGGLLFAEGEGKRISKRNKDGSMTTLTEGPAGKPLLAPNDLIIDAKGGQSMVTISNVNQSNGVIHVVDTVLMPAT